MNRWTAIIHYSTDAGIVDVTHDLSEIGDIQDFVERGPHWDAIDHIEIVRCDKQYEGLTVEKAEAL